VDNDDASVLTEQGRRRLIMPERPVIHEALKMRETSKGQKKSRWIRISSGQEGRPIYYRIDNGKTSLYTSPFVFDRAGTIYAWTADGGVCSAFAARQLEPFYDLLDVDKSLWKIIHVDSQQPGEGEAANCIDGNPNTYWHTNWTSTREKMPHDLQIDLGRSYTLAGVTYLPRQGQSNGRIEDYELYAAQSVDHWSRVARGRFANSADRQRVLFRSPINARYIKLIALSEHSGEYYTSLAELDVMALRQTD
jgi:hypothetical protein